MTRPTPIERIDALVRPEDDWLCVVAAAPDEAVMLWAPLELEAGPAKKKFPATGLPSPSSRAKTETSKPNMGVDAFTKRGTSMSKFSGCT